MKNPTFEVNFIVATLDPYSDGQSTCASSSIPAKITQVNNEKVNITMEDQEALLNENWDDNFATDFTENSSKPKNKSKRASFEEMMAKAANNKNKENVKSILKSNGTIKRRKIFSLAEDDLEENSQQIGSPEPLLKPEHLADNIIPRSPESPRTKKAKLVFGRCFEATFSSNNLGQVLAANSDSE